MAIRWYGYVNDDVDLSPPEGRKTRKEAIQDCINDREYIKQNHGGKAPGFEYYVEKTNVTETEIEVLKTVHIRFRPRKRSA